MRENSANIVMKYPIDKRISLQGLSFCLGRALNGIVPGSIAFAGITPTGEITEDFRRPDHFESYVTINSTEILTHWLSRLMASKKDYRHYYYESLHKDISIYAPKNLDRAVLLEYMILSGTVDVETHLKYLSSCIKQGYHEDSYIRIYPRIALNGENASNRLNILIDFEYGILVARNNARLSINGYNFLAQKPLEVLFEVYNSQPMYNPESETDDLKLRAKELALRQIANGFK